MERQKYINYQISTIILSKYNPSFRKQKISSSFKNYFFELDPLFNKIITQVPLQYQIDSILFATDNILVNLRIMKEQLFSQIGDWSRQEVQQVIEASKLKNLSSNDMLELIEQIHMDQPNIDNFLNKLQKRGLAILVSSQMVLNIVTVESITQDQKFLKRQKDDFQNIYKPPKQQLSLPIRYTDMFLSRCYCWFKQSYIKQCETIKQRCQQDHQNKMEIQAGQKNKLVEDYKLFLGYFQGKQMIIYKKETTKSQQNGQIFQESNQSLTTTLKNESPQDVKLTHKFFCYNKLGERYSVDRILSMDVTSVFQKQLDEVKELILNQLMKQESYLSTKMLEVLNQYNQFFFIKQNNSDFWLQLKRQQFQAFLNSYKEYLRQDQNQIYFNGGVKELQSPLLSYWKQLFQKMNKSKKIDHNLLLQKVKYFFDSKKIILYFSPLNHKDNIYATLNGFNIYISLNHIKKGMSVKQFRSGPLKPYLFLCLSHEIIHSILRILLMPQNNSNDPQGSFVLNENKTGSILLKLIMDQMPNIKRQFERINVKLSLSEAMRKGNFDRVSRRLNEAQILLCKPVEKFYPLNIIKYFSSELKIIEQSLQFLQKLDQFVERIDSQDFLRKIFVLYAELDQKQINSKYKLKEQNQVKQYQFILSIVMSLRYLPNFVARNGEQLNKFKDLSDFIFNVKSYFEFKHQCVDGLVKLIRQEKAANFKDQRANKIIAWVNEGKLLQFQKCVYYINNSTFQQFSHQIVSFNYKILGFIRQSSYKRRNFEFLKLKKRKDEDNEQGLSFICALLLMKDLCMQVCKMIKLSQIYLIATQIPSLIQHLSENKLDSGDYFQSQTFPQLAKTGKIYAKDYQKFQYLTSESAEEIGRAPKQEKQQEDYAQVHGLSSSIDHSMFSMKELECQILGKDLDINEGDYDLTQKQIGDPKVYADYKRNRAFLRKIMLEKKMRQMKE